MIKKILVTLLVLLIFVSLVAAAGVLLIDDQVNILLYGLEGKRSDVMMLVMLDASKNETHVIAIPRDTYNPVPGHDGLGAKKQNAVYGFKEGGGPEGLVKSIENLVGVDIDYFVEIKYEGVKSVVDLMGGIPVDVPFDMNYKDPYATPPLLIDLRAGEQILEGEDVIGYLRFRKSSDGKIKEGDIQRIDRQQAFLKSATKEALTWKLPIFANEALKYVESDLSAIDVVKLSLGILGMKQEDVYFHVLPDDRIGTGDDGLSYVFHSPKETKQLLEDIKNGVFVPESEVVAEEQ